MKIKLSQLRKLIKEEVSHMVGPMNDPSRFLHGEESGGTPTDDEGSMAKSQLFSMKDMAHEVCDLLQQGDQLPAWAQSHIAVAHENLRQVHGYLTGDAAADSYSHSEKLGLSEGHTRITQEEIKAWLSGDWGFTSDDDVDR
jgi:hypothetical protein